MKLKIGELSKLTGCQIVTIRYYEKEGLLNQPIRSEGNYRMYSGEDLERLKFILHCRKHDMNLSEIKDLLAYRDKPNKDCIWINKLIQNHIENVEEQIKSLKQLKTYLKDLKSKCEGGNSSETCGIMKSLCDRKLCSCFTENVNGKC